jgi:hypothetical protein
MLRSPLGRLIERFGIRHDALFPVPRSFHAEKLYFKIGEPVRTAHYEGRDDDEACWAVRNQVASTIEEGIAELMKRREGDPERYTGQLVRKELGAAFRELVSVALGGRGRERSP